MNSSSQDHDPVAGSALEGVQPFQWTETRQRQLEELARRGHTGLEIAAKLGITRNAVLGRCYRTGVELPITPQKAARRLERLRKTAEGRRGRPRSVACATPSRKGKPPSVRCYSDTQVAMALAAKLAGASYPKAARLIGASQATIYLWSRKPSLVALGRALYERAKADAAHRAQAKSQAEEDRRDAIRAWNEGIYRFFGARDRELLRAWVNGARGEHLGAAHRITRQRVSQVVKRARSLGLKEIRGRWQAAAAR